MWHSKHNGPYTAANERHHDRNSAQDWERMGMSCCRIKNTDLIPGYYNYATRAAEAKLRTALTRPWPPDWSSPSSWLLANKGLVSMPSCGYVENCWFWAKGRDYMEGELKGDSTNSGTCAEVSLGTPSCGRQCMEMQCTFRITCRNMQPLIFAVLWSAQSQKVWKRTVFICGGTDNLYCQNFQLYPKALL